MQQVTRARRSPKRILEFGGSAGTRQEWIGQRWQVQKNMSKVAARYKRIAERHGTPIRYVGVDPKARPNVQVVKGLNGRVVAKFRFKQGSVSQLPYPYRNESFDEIQMQMINDDNTLRRQNAKQILHELHRILRPGGQLFFSADYRIYDGPHSTKEGFRNGMMRLLHRLNREGLFTIKLFSTTNQLPKSMSKPRENGTGIRGIPSPRNIETFTRHFSHFSENTEIVAVLQKKER